MNCLKKITGAALILAMLISLCVFPGAAIPSSITGISLNILRDVVTLTFDDTLSSPLTGAALAAKVSVRTSDGSAAAMASSNPVTISGNKMEIRLAAGLEDAAQSVHIASDTFTDQVGVIISPVFNCEGPKLADTNPVNVSDDRKTVVVKFAGSFIGYPSPEALTDGGVRFSSNNGSSYSDVSANNVSVDYGKREITITFATALTGTTNRISFRALKVESSVKAGSSQYGNLNLKDIITPAIDASFDVLPPQFESSKTTLSSDGKTINLFFDKNIQNVHGTTTLALEAFKSRVWISRNNGGYKALVGLDTVTIGSNYVRIVLRDAVTGTSNSIKIDGGNIKDAQGNILNTDVIATLPAAGTNPPDNTIPSLNRTTLSSNLRNITLEFSRTIIKNPAITDTELKNRVQISRNGGSYQNLSSSDSVSISGSQLYIYLNSPISGRDNRIRILASALANSSGTVITDTIVSEYLSDNNSNNNNGYGPSIYRAMYNSSRGEIVIEFDKSIYYSSNSSLRNGITISRNGGSYYSLASRDTVEVYPSDTMVITLYDPLRGSDYARVRIAGNTVRDSSGNYQAYSQTSDTVGEYYSNDNDPYYDNTESITLAGQSVSFVSLSTRTDNGKSTRVVGLNSTSAINAIGTSSRNSQFAVKTTSAMSGVNINMQGHVFKAFSDKAAYISIKCGGVSYLIPTESINVNTAISKLGAPAGVAQNVDVTVSVVPSGSGVISALNANAGSLNYSVLTTPMEVKIAFRYNSNTYEEVKFPNYMVFDYALTSNQLMSPYITAVRVESNGKVNHIPSYFSNLSSSNTLTAKTPVLGNFAIISCERSFNDTPAWAKPAVDSLASRLILNGMTGNTLSPSAYVSRAEFSTVVSKTIGIIHTQNTVSKFFDVAATDSYFDAVICATDYDIIRGYPNSMFKPDDKITRQEAMAILARTLRFISGTTAASSIPESQADAVLSKFRDAGKIASWAKIDMAECVSRDVIRGDNNGNVNPNANVTRAELIQMMYNILTTNQLIRQ